MHPQKCMVHSSNVGHANVQTKHQVLRKGFSFQSNSSSARKRKADTSPKLKEQESSNSKRKKEKRGGAEKKASGESSKEKSSTQTDFIHVRARRGQATDSHSLAERVRRERISERMKRLQELVPACSNAMGKACMLDEIINYVQSLQKQVEFLSMKLSAVDRGMHYFSSSHFFDGELNAAGNYSNILVHGVPPSDHHFDLSGLQSKSVRPPNACSDLNIALEPPELVVQRTMSAPVTLPTIFLDSSFDDHSASAWDTAAFYSLIHSGEFQQGSEPALPSQSMQVPRMLLINDCKTNCMEIPVLLPKCLQSDPIFASGNAMPENLKMEM